MAPPLLFPPTKTSGLKQPGNFGLGQLPPDAGDDRLPFQVFSFTPPHHGPVLGCGGFTIHTVLRCPWNHGCQDVCQTQIGLHGYERPRHKRRGSGGLSQVAVGIYSYVNTTYLGIHGLQDLSCSLP